MARTDRFYIGMLEPGAGLNTALRPFAIPDNAFEVLNNAYVFRGRVRKRFGSLLMEGSTGGITGLPQLQSRLRINLGNTSGAGAFSGTVPGAIFGIGQMFSIGSQVYTVQATGTPVTMITNGAGSGTYDTSNGAYVFTGAAFSTAVFFYPAQPVMGFTNYVTNSISLATTIAFDTQFAYLFGTTGWARLGTAVWTGSNADYFWSTNYRGATEDLTYIFTTNYHAGATLSDSDPMKYWDGSAWNNFTPRVDVSDATYVVLTARIILPFKDRLLLLNVVENKGVSPGTNTRIVNRVRYSSVGNVLASDSFEYPQGSFIDAPTKEAIVTAQFLKDRLIVFFENSTWELAYTGNQILPFKWQKINTELGAESTFSEVPFDKVILGIGNVGIHACNGSNVTRIDDQIPNSVFEIHNENNGVARVCGIRDYYSELVYWSIPSINRSSTFPFNDQVLIYNYKTGSWAYNDDSITAFGYFQQAANEGETWATYESTWAESGEAWNSGELQSQFRAIVAGNQEGFTFIIDPDIYRNAPALQITNMSYTGETLTITSVNHNLQPGFNGTGDYIIIENAQGVTGVNNVVFPVNAVLTANTFTVITTAFSGTYTGGGTLALVSGLSIQTKQYNFYADKGLNASINKVDFLVDKTASGQVTVDYAVSSSGESLLLFGALSGTLVGTGLLDTSPYTDFPLEMSQSRLWHPIYPFAQGECIQFLIYLTDEQIRDTEISWSDFEMHAMSIYATPTSRLQ